MNPADSPIDLSEQIRTVAALLAEEMQAVEDGSHPMNTHNNITHALSTAHSMQILADAALSTLVSNARAQKITWQVIGDALGISRQAAFQRFGNPIDPRTRHPMTTPSNAHRTQAITNADRFLDALTAHNWDEAASQLGPVVGEQLDTDGLAAAWAQVVSLGGELEKRHPASTLSLADEVTVVEEHLDFEASDLVARISYNADGDMVGLWFLPADQALTDRPQQ